MSKFWAKDESSDSEDDQSVDIQVNQKAPTGGRFGANYDESDSGLFLKLFLI